jgi:hypothetical protein
MDFLHKITSGVISVLLPGIWLAAAIHPAYADSAVYRLTHGRRQPPGMVQPGVPSAARPLYSPPGFVDRSSPISQRPFAQPFIDRGTSLSDRPLAPIGGGELTVPDSAPFIWCQGQWIRATPLPSGCITR